MKIVDSYILDDYEYNLVDTILLYKAKAGKKSEDFCNNILYELMWDILDNRNYDRDTESMEGNDPDWGEDYASIVIYHSDEAKRNAEKMMEEMEKKYGK